MQADDRSLSGTLVAVYDLLVQPNTYDVIWFLLVADRERRRCSLENIHVVFIGCQPGLERQDAAYRQVVSDSAWRDRITNMLIPLAWAVPSVCNVSVMHDREGARHFLSHCPRANVLPKNYVVGFDPPHYWTRDVLTLRDPPVKGIFRASDAARSYVDRWLTIRSAVGCAVSITIRNYRYMPARNSNLAAWAEFAQYLTQRGYLPVFVPDTESLAEGVPAEIAEFPYIAEAAWNINLRLALYERAFMNLGVNNGPAQLFLQDDLARGIMFKMVTKGVPQAEPWFIAHQGFEIGGQMPHFTPFQRFVWEDDDFEVIKREFEEMERRIHEHEPGPAKIS